METSLLNCGINRSGSELKLHGWKTAGTLIVDREREREILEKGGAPGKNLH